jgi:peptidoglycan DL-endopeptidase CwlO
MRPRSSVLIVVVTACLLSQAAVGFAQPSPGSELEQAGDRLQRVTEEYNQARLRRAELENRLATTMDRVERSETTLATSRKKLGVAIRDLYKHPAARLSALFQADNYDELQHGSAYAGFVGESLEGLILHVRRARAAERAQAAGLTRLRDDAKRQESAIAAQRREAADAFERAQRLLANSAVQRAREAERRADLAAAGSLARERIHDAGPVRPGAMKAVQTAAAQIGDPYRWGAEGPDRFDCSGLTMYAWRAGGVSLPHSSRAQYSSLPHVSLSELAPGDLVFSGSPIHHVAIYEGDGVVIAAPHSGESVRRQSVWSLNPVGAARP